MYCLIDLLGDLGGVTEVIMLMFGFFLYPISEHSYVMRATSRMFLAKTKDNKLFARCNAEDMEGDDDAKKMDKNLLNEGEGQD